MLTAITLAAAMALQPANADADLPRRGSLGVALGPSEQGVEIVALPPGSPAAGTGLAAGDVLVGIRGIAVPDLQGLTRATTALPAGEEVTVTVRRDGEAMSFTLVPGSLPEQTIASYRADYDHVTLRSGDRVRTITLYPDDQAMAGQGGLPAIYFMGGIPCQSLDALARPGGGHNPLFRRMLEAGFVVGFADKPGVGDSEGISCFDGGYDREIEAYGLAAQQLKAREATDPERIYAVGMSMGGFQAPLVDQQADFAGIATWGAGMQPWFDYMVTNFRWRYQLEGKDPATITGDLRLSRSILADLLIDGMSAEELRAARPEDVSRFEQAYGPLESGFGRSVTFLQEADRAPLWQGWYGFDGHYLGLHGEYDWVATSYDHGMIAEMLEKYDVKSAEFRILPGLDHTGTRHETLADSFENRFRGEQNTLVDEAIVSWLTEKAQESNG